MKHEFSGMALENIRNPKVTLLNYKEIDRENPDDWKVWEYDFTFPYLFNYKETKDTIEFTTTTFINCNKITRLKVVYTPVYYERCNLNAGEFENVYKVEYVGMNLKTGDEDKDAKQLVRITYCFKKIENYCSYWDFNCSDEVKDYYEECNKRWREQKTENKIEELQEQIEVLKKGLSE